MQVNIHSVPGLQKRGIDPMCLALEATFFHFAPFLACIRTFLKGGRMSMAIHATIFCIGEGRHP